MSNHPLRDTTIYSVLQPGFAKLDAKYYYYLHGPLARMELGDTSGRVQGVDYAYTLQGWIKGTNSSAATDNKDMGADSLRVAKDAYGYSLYYYGTGTDTLDYASISSVNPFSTQPAGLSYFKSLYNGNIAGMSTNITRLTDPWHYYTYKYDQLNRLRQTYTYKVNTSAVATRVLDYSERFTYDGNGNIDSAARYMGANTKMDSTLYHYNTTGSRLINNRLNYITDNITTHNWPYGLDNQPVNNYTYDAIGNMTVDVIDSVSNINWTVYNKIQNLTNSKGTIAYSYDPAGQRVTKTVTITRPASTITTYYVRDAQGNTLAIYDNAHSTINWKEQDLYGSSRLGRWNVNSVITNSLNGVNVWDTVGYKEYELSNHLGNVLTTITDKRVQHTTNNTSVDYFNTDVSTAQEYYAFGGLMAGRNYTYLKPFRYGFNGKENDNDVQGIGRQQDYGMRIYDPLTGRFFSVDPLEAKYPFYTPFQFAGNSPIKFIDLDGGEPKDPGTYEGQGAIAPQIVNGKPYEGSENDRWTWKNETWNFACFNTTNSELTSVFPSGKADAIKQLEITVNLQGDLFGLTSKRSLAHFLSQAGTEVNGFANGINVEESLNYSVDGLVATFGKYFYKKTAVADKLDAALYGYIKDKNGKVIQTADQEAIANYVYANRMSNGNVESGDGYNYRGRGIFQLTGKSNYQAFTNFINISGVDFVATPSLIKSTEYSIKSAMWYFKTTVLDKINIEDATVEGVTRKVNGGTNGLDSRKATFNKAIEDLKQ